MLRHPYVEMTKFTVQYKTAPVPCQGRVDQVDEEEGERDDEEQDGPVAVDSAGRMSRKVEPLRQLKRNTFISFSFPQLPRGGCSILYTVTYLNVTEIQVPVCY